MSLLQTFTETFNQTKTKKKETKKVSGEQIRNDLIEAMNLEGVIPDEMSEAQALRYVRGVAMALRKRYQEGVSLKSEPENPEALLALPDKKGAYKSLTEEALKETIEQVYGSRPRGRFNADSWRDKLFADRKAVAS